MREGNIAVIAKCIGVDNLGGRRATDRYKISFSREDLVSKSYGLISRIEVSR